jgi:hypothetical protein
MKLTERKIETLAIEHGRKDRLIFDDAQRGLAVRVTASGSRTYLCQYSLHGQKWRVPLGAYSALSLSSAREAAAAIMGDVAKGRNPAAERKEAAAAEQAKRTRDRLTLSSGWPKNTQRSSAADPICHKEICGGYPKMSWSSLSRPFNDTKRSKRTKREGNGPPVSIEWT